MDSDRQVTDGRLTGAGARFASFVSGRKTKWAVLVFWLLIVVAAGPLAGKLGDVQENDTQAWLPNNAESTKVLEQQEDFQDTEDYPAVVVYERDGGITPADEAKARADVAGFREVEHVVPGRILGPETSADGEAMQTIVYVNAGDDWEALGDASEDIREIAKADAASGIDIYTTGPVGVTEDFADAFAGIDGKLLFAALGVVIVILLLTYRSPILWVFPLLVAGVAVVGSEAIIYLLAKHADLTVNAQSAGILTVLVIGAGTDYALLLVARYREELRRHEDRHEAMALAVRRAGPAILASGATVMLGLICLAVADLNSTRGLGPVCAIGVGVALLAMVTLLPTLLVIASRWVFWPVKPDFGTDEPSYTGMWSRIGTAIGRRPRVVWGTTAVLLGAMCLGLLNLSTGVLSNEESFTDKPDSIVGQEIVEEHFGGGSGQPILVLSNAAQAGEVRDTMLQVPGIDGVAEPIVKDGKAFLQADLSGSADSPAARETVVDMRDAVHPIDGADAVVGGDSAIAYDVDKAMDRDMKLIIPLVLVAVLVILGLLLRSIVAPLILMGTVVLSFGAALGVSALVFEHIFDLPKADSSFPLMVFVFLVALGIDYNIFLMTRVREEAQKAGARMGALRGLTVTGGVITSAGCVLAATFAVMGTIPMAWSVQMGFAVAFGVLLDTIIVRAVLVTAIGLDIGRWMWWPSPLFHDDAAGTEEPAALGDSPVPVGGGGQKS